MFFASLAGRLLPADPASRRLAVRFALVLGVIAVAAVVFLSLTGEKWPGTVYAVEQAGKKLKIEDYVKTWLWWGVVIDLILALGLMATVKWWAGSAEARTLSSQRRSGAFFIVLAGLLVVVVVVRLPRLPFSFYNDEAHNFVRLVAGDLKHESPLNDNFRFRQTKWVETLWYNTSGNNSMPSSILTRLSYDAWRKITGAVEGQVCEAAVRVPSFLFGLASLTLIGLAMRDLAGDRAALLSVLAGALHGWHARYSTEARGYSILIFAVVMLVWFLSRALRSGSWRHWLGYGAAVFLCAWSFNGSVYFLATLNGLLILRQLWLWRRQEHSFDQVLRPVIAGVFAVMVAVPLMMPHLPQLAKVLKEFTSIHGVMGGAWWADVSGFLLIGCRWVDVDSLNPVNLSVGRMLADQPWLLVPLLLLIAVMFAGFARLVRKGGGMALYMIAAPLGTFLGWALMSMKGNFLHLWYLTYALPFALFAVGAGLDWVISTLAGKRSSAIAWVVGILLVSTTLAWPASIAWQYRHIGKQDERGPILAVRGDIYPRYEKSAEALKPIVGAFWCNSVIYDPRSVIIQNMGTLDTLVQRAKAEQRPLYVCFSHRSFAVSYIPDVVKRLEEGGEFEHQRTFWGQEEDQFTVQLYKLKPAP